MSDFGSVFVPAKAIEEMERAEAARTKRPFDAVLFAHRLDALVELAAASVRALRGLSADDADGSTMLGLVKFVGTIREGHPTLASAFAVEFERQIRELGPAK